MYPSLKSPVFEGATLLYPFGPGIVLPYEYEGLKTEAPAARTTAWIGTQLMISPIYDVKGPDAVAFLNSIGTNEFSNLSDHGLRHAILCNERGQIMTDGVVIKLGPDHFRTYWLNPPIDFLLETSGLRVQGEDLSFQEYFIQISGERSLEILEQALQVDLHDIRFATHKEVVSDGRRIRIIRLGMSGELAYEAHGPMADFDEVYQKIWKAGEQFGAKKLGMNAYSGPNHTPAGFPNIHIHYPLPWFESEEGRYRGLSEYLAARPHYGMYNRNRLLTGSVGGELQPRFVTPYDVGWGKLVRLNKGTAFPGQKALADIAANPPRTVVTLEWNPQDVADIYATQLMGREVEPCEAIDFPIDMYYQANAVNLSQGKGCIYRADAVFSGKRQIGISSGRVIDHYYRRMLSLAFVEHTYARLGTELTVLWGTPGTPQRSVRATVARFPYHELGRNEVRNVEDVPRPAALGAAGGHSVPHR